jgi:hypothetical protein
LKISFERYSLVLNDIPTIFNPFNSLLSIDVNAFPDAYNGLVVPSKY